MQLQNEEVAGITFSECYSTTYGQVSYNETYQVLIIEALSSYIPLDSFKNIFNSATEVSSQYLINKVIFDKRSLRTFHQPSMEWYFTDWKIHLYQQHGVDHHVKILPDIEWFAKAVEAGRAEIHRKYNLETLNHVTIEYKDSVYDAIFR